MKFFSRIVVTGASGLLGSEVCNVLSEKGYSFTAIAHSKKTTFKNAENIRLDLSNPDFIETLLSLKPRNIIHCASLIPGVGNFSDEQIFTKNRLIDQHIFEVCGRSGSRLTYISSTSVYGFPLTKLVSEEDQIGENLSLYSQGKLASEKEIIKRSIDAKILRINAPYSARQSTRTVLRVFIENALNDKDISFYGSGTRHQDFTHANDIANLIVDSLDNPSSGTFNISANKPISMKDLALLVVDVVSASCSQVKAAGLPDTQEDHLAMYDTSYARKILGWSPTIDLKSGILGWVNKIRHETGHIV